ncbi:MAG: hypothetical protein P8X64_13665 [Anaerolineales bacterium]
MAEFSLDLIGTLFGALLTLMVLSYVIKDNVLFRIAMYLFIGVASGYAGAIAMRNVILPALVDPLLDPGGINLLGWEAFGTFLIPWLLAILLALKLSPRLARFGSLPLAMLVGVGAAVVVGGGITGTLIPQGMAAADSLAPANLFPAAGESASIWLERAVSALIVLLATISTLIYFRFAAQRDVTGTTRRSRLTAILAYVGRFFIAITFGVMYAGALTAAILVLGGRFEFLRQVINTLMGGS